MYLFSSFFKPGGRLISLNKTSLEGVTFSDAAAVLQSSPDEVELIVSQPKRKFALSESDSQSPTLRVRLSETHSQSPTLRDRAFINHCQDFASLVMKTSSYDFPLLRVSERSEKFLESE